MNDTCAILVNYFGAADIAAAVASARADVPELPIVVVDNSDDATEHYQLKQLLPSDVKLLRAPGNIGFGRACNLAAQATPATYLLLVNPDVQLLPGCVQALRQALEEDSTLAAVAPRQFLDSGCQWRLPPAWLPTALRTWATEYAQRDAIAARRFAKATRAENLRYWTAQAPVLQRALSGGIMMLRRSALRPQEPLFDPRFFMYFEDSDLCLRLRQRQAKMAMVPQAHAVHAWRNLPHKAVLMAQGSNLYFQKHYPHDRWLRKAQHITATTPPLPLSWQPGQTCLAVPEDWHTGWVLELSISPLLQPAIGMAGTGAWANVPAQILAGAEGAPAYARLGGLHTPASDCQRFCWLGSTTA